MSAYLSIFDFSDGFIIAQLGYFVDFCAFIDEIFELGDLCFKLSKNEIFNQ